MEISSEFKDLRPVFLDGSSDPMKDKEWQKWSDLETKIINHHTDPFMHCLYYDPSDDVESDVIRKPLRFGSVLIALGELNS